MRCTVRNQAILVYRSDAPEIGAVLYGYLLRHNPDQPRWINRDYFILPPARSMFLYAWLNLSGYDVSSRHKAFSSSCIRKRRGHPEYFETPGVECTTGPLGQGVGNAVGFCSDGQRNGGKRILIPATIAFSTSIFFVWRRWCLQEASRGSERLRRAFRPR